MAGFTVAFSFVNAWLSSFKFQPPVFKHNRTFCSFFDLVGSCTPRPRGVTGHTGASSQVMPFFFVGVGFGFRLTSLRYAKREGFRQTASKVEI